MSASRSLSGLFAGILPVAVDPEAEPADIETQTSLHPNIVVIVTDDMRDSDWQALPKSDRLVAQQGTIFPNFFMTTPICSPSRASILTGQYAHNHQVLRNSGRNGGFAQFVQRDLGAQSIGTALHTAGYRTGLFGKFLNGMPQKGPLPGAWEQWLATSELAYFRPQMNDNGKARQFKKKSDYSTDILRARATEFIRSTPPEQPLFLFFTPKAPHAPASPAPRDRGKFSGARRARTPDFNEADVSDKPAHIRSLPGLNDAAIADLDVQEQMRLESLIATDDAVEDIIYTLDQTGRLANSYVFVVGDNGWCIGSHRWPTKDIPYNESTKIRMAVSGPRFSRGAVDTRLGANIDIAATIAELAGIPFGGDGVSLLQPATRDGIVLEAWSIPYSALRNERYLYVEYTWGERELYDYEEDPYELDNLLANWEGHAPTVASENVAAGLKARLDQLRWCTGVGCQ